MKLETDTSEDVDKIEKFLKIGSTQVKTDSSNVTKRYKSNEELLRILGCNPVNKMIKIPKIVDPAVKDGKQIIIKPIRKRIISAIPKESPEKKRRGRRKKIRIHEAQVMECSAEFSRYTELKLDLGRRRKARLTHHLHKAKITKISTRNDSQTIRPVTVKEEVIDLTQEEQTVYMFLKFANSLELPQEEEELCTLSESTECTVTVKIHGDYSNEITWFTPNVQFHTTPTIDLTVNENKYLALVSEKECVSRILPIIFSCHKLFEIKNKMTETFFEIEKCLTQITESSNWDDTCKYITNKAASLGYSLLEILSDIFVKNLDFGRFLKTISSKLQSQRKVKVSSQTICFLLYWMLNSIQDACTGKLAKQILKNTVEFNERGLVKEEEDEETEQEAFSKEQLNKLQRQINQYHEICRRQDDLINSGNWRSTDSGSDKRL